MSRNMGRPNKYQTNVEPYLEEIKMMALDMTEEQIAKTLGVSYSAFREYKKQHEALSDSLKKGRKSLVFELKSVLIERARGYRYTESKRIVEDGVVVREEVTEKYAHPDVASLNLLLKNYDKDNWANDPQMLAMKEKELELRKEMAEKDDW